MNTFIFAFLTVTAFGFFFKKANKTRRNIMLGRSESITGDFGQRLKNVLLVALGQQKMFKKWLPAVLHFAIYAAFVITQIELLEIFIDGFTGNHRLIWQTIEGTFFSGFYTFIISSIEVLSVLAFVATFAFLARRNLLKIPRFQKPEMNGFPKLDGNIILYLEIALIIFIFMMNSGDLALQDRAAPHYPLTDRFAISQFIAPFWAGLSTETVFVIERIGWWGHILTVFVFLNYLPYSKHLHILLAFPNVYFASLRPKGEMTHLDSVTAQVNELFEETPSIAEMPTAPPIFSTSKKVEDESIDDIFGDNSKTENIDDIFGDNSKTENIDDIFGDNSKTENIDDIFGDNSKTENIDDIFGDNSKTENIDDIFGDNSKTENIDDIFGDNSKTENLDDIFGDNSKTENLDDIFGDNSKTENLDDFFAETPAKPAEKPQKVAASIAAPPPKTVIEEPEIPKFGVSDVFDLSWRQVLSAYSCTECGRCTAVCPANLTGKKLSPRKIMMDVRDRAEEIGNTLDANPNLTKENYSDGKDLFSYISEEELRACTTCNACVEACPVMISPLEIILDMRRNLVLDKAVAPESWNVMFTNIENNAAPWQFSANDRDKWITE